MDYLEVKGIRCYGYTGYFPAENELGQWFEVDLRFGLDLSCAAQSDALDDALDYRQVIDQVQTLVRTQVFKTIERLAGAIAEALLSLKKFDQITVRLTKLSPPIPDFLGSVTVELTRRS